MIRKNAPKNLRLRRFDRILAERGITLNGEPIISIRQFCRAAGISSSDTAAPLFDGGHRKRAGQPPKRIGVDALNKAIALAGISLDEPLSTLFEPDAQVNGKAKKKKAP